MKKISLTGSAQPKSQSAAAPPATEEVLELFFNTGIAYHHVTIAGDLPDSVSSFVVMKDPAGG